MSFEQKVALVAGGGRGIGFGIAKSLAAEGWSLAIFGRRPAAERTDQVKQLIESAQHSGYSIQVCYYVCDISSFEQRQVLFDSVKQDFGRLNALINSAGIGANSRSDILELTPESYDIVMKTNLTGPFFLAQSAAKWMLEQKRADSHFSGTIINISSINAEMASINRAECCIAKAGLSMTTKLWASRLSGEGINVYEIRPGVVRTDLTLPVAEQWNKRIADGLALQSRWIEPTDIGKAAAMLLRGDLPYSSGQVITVDGGITVSRL